MNIRIKHMEMDWLLCIGYKRELGSKIAHPEPFLFFSPELPKKDEREAIMLALAESVVRKLHDRMWTLVAVKSLDFKEFADTMACQADFSDVFSIGMASKEWKDNLTVLTKQFNAMRKRLNGGTEVPISVIEYARSIFGVKKNAARKN